MHLVLQLVLPTLLIFRGVAMFQPCRKGLVPLAWLACSIVLFFIAQSQRGPGIADGIGVGAALQALFFLAGAAIVAIDLVLALLALAFPRAATGLYVTGLCFLAMVSLSVWSHGWDVIAWDAKEAAREVEQHEQQAITDRALSGVRNLLQNGSDEDVIAALKAVPQGPGGSSKLISDILISARKPVIDALATYDLYFGYLTTACKGPSAEMLAYFSAKLPLVGAQRMLSSFISGREKSCGDWKTREIFKALATREDIRTACYTHATVTRGFINDAIYSGYYNIDNYDIAVALIESGLPLDDCGHQEQYLANAVSHFDDPVQRPGLTAFLKAYVAHGGSLSFPVGGIGWCAPRPDMDMMTLARATNRHTLAKILLELGAHEPSPKKLQDAVASIPDTPDCKAWIGKHN